MRYLDPVLVAGVVLVAGAVQAAPVTYSGKGGGDKAGELAPRAGNKVVGTSKCANNEFTIDVTVDGASVKGSFKEKTSRRHQSQTTRDGTGAFKIDLPRNREQGTSSGNVSHSGTDDSQIHVRGVINEREAQIPSKTPASSRRRSRGSSEADRRETGAAAQD